MTVAFSPRQRLPSRTHPTRVSSILFAAKATALRARRAAQNAVAGPPRLARTETTGFPHIIAESRTPLWSDETLTERGFQLGKNQNLRVACRALNGVMIQAGAVFSFWRHVGPPIAARGFVSGRMLKQGCMVASVGGGLCQLSNALYDVALESGCEIVERHTHSRIVPGSAAALGRDATVAWNYVDLRFVPGRDMRLSTHLDRDSLTVRLTARAKTTSTRVMSGHEPAPELSTARDCSFCDETGCYLHKQDGSSRPAPSSRHVFLVDEAWPEFRRHIGDVRKTDDCLGFPLNGARVGLSRYSWPADGFGRTASAPVAALRRTLALRSAGLQGTARRQAELAGTRRIALSLARLLTQDVTSVTVAQSYLPFLWRSGHLGGRRISVLMTRLPIAVLEARLDAVAAVHPERGTLTDFRAPPWLVEAEAEALTDADQIITAHAGIAALFGDRAVHLPWEVPTKPPPGSASGCQRIVFPGPTVARKGAYAVRDAAIALDLEVMAQGAELEGPDFWRGVRMVPAGEWEGVAAMVQPALLEDQPRRLLAALAAGVPVIATSACGIEPQPGLVLVPPEDPAALIAALATLVRPGRS